MDGDPGVRGEPVTRLAGTHEERRAERVSRFAVGTLACPACDAPVSPGADGVAPADPLSCPVCLHAGAVREFLTLGDPVRPARVELRVVQRL
jgi:hypothetical protein